MFHDTKRHASFLVLAAALVCGAVIGSSAQAPAPEPAQVKFERDVAPLFNKYCSACHGGARPQADVLLRFKDEADARSRGAADADFWSRVATELSTQQMPPAGRTKPTEQERALLVDWINANVLTG